MISIRKKQSDDLAALFDVWQTAVADTHDFVSVEDKAAIADLVKKQYLPGADLDVAVDEAGVPVAFMGMTDNEIDALFVHAGARGQGIGGQMVDLAVARFDSLVVEVNEQNTQAVGFYERMGFQAVDRKPLDGQGRPYPLLVMKRA